MPTVVSTPGGIEYAQLAAWKGAIRLEALGMKHSSGRSVTAMAKKKLGVKGGRDKVIAAIQERMGQLLKEAGK